MFGLLPISGKLGGYIQVEIFLILWEMNKLFGDVWVEVRFDLGWVENYLKRILETMRKFEFKLFYLNFLYYLVVFIATI